jgi:hypothetical protein
MKYLVAQLQNTGKKNGRGDSVQMCAEISIWPPSLFNVCKHDMLQDYMYTIRLKLSMKGKLYSNR